MTPIMTALTVCLGAAIVVFVAVSRVKARYRRIQDHYRYIRDINQALAIANTPGRGAAR